MMQVLLRRFQADDCGNIHAVGYLLLVTVIAIGMIAGLATLRDGVVQEYGDTALALENLDQSFTMALPSGIYTFPDPGPFPNLDPPGAAPYGIVLTTAPALTGENQTLPVLPVVPHFPAASAGEGSSP